MRSRVWTGILGVSLALGSVALGSAAVGSQATPVAVVAATTTAAETPAGQLPVVLAQYSESSSSSSSSRTRSYRGIIRLAVFGVIILVSGIGWVIKKATAG
jgi:hypothetical protein